MLVDKQLFAACRTLEDCKTVLQTQLNAAPYRPPITEDEMQKAAEQVFNEFVVNR